ncbi:TO45-2 [Artemisia annua]|uniref:TO45-2 n=1 Tax=Artemisia annua TaxID=35608 RepID=A0A2U1LX81_ARTAN|nr:TO45-2 [Artemisia annua]
MVHPAYPEQLITIGGNFSNEGRRQLITLLKNSQDVFAWEPSDMTGVPRRVAEHRLNVNVQDRPIAQKKRIFSEEKNLAINKEVEEWVPRESDTADLAKKLPNALTQALQEAMSNMPPLPSIPVPESPKSSRKPPLKVVLVLACKRVWTKDMHLKKKHDPKDKGKGPM